MEGSSRWLSFHIHYHNYAAHDTVIVRCIAPLVDRLDKSGVLLRYFFIRYSEYGPHLRLRLQCRSSDAAAVREEAYQHISGFLAASPSEDVPLPSPPRRANNTIYQIAYDPETLRYGGEGGVKVAEAHFNDSSRAVVALLTATQGSASSDGWKFVAAVELASMIALSGGFTGDRFVRYVDDHLAHIVMPDPHAFTLVEAPPRAVTVLADRMQRIRSLYDSEGGTPPHGLQSWKTALDCTSASLAKCLSTSTLFNEVHPQLGGSKKYVLILQSYTHLLLNRLGYWGKSEHAVLRSVRDLGSLVNGTCL